MDPRGWLRRIDDRVLGPSTAGPRQVTERFVLRIAYGLLAACFATMAGAVLIDPNLGVVAVSFAFTGALYLGRLTEARESRQGRGIRLSPETLDRFAESPSALPSVGRETNQGQIRAATDRG